MRIFYLEDVQKIHVFFKTNQLDCWVLGVKWMEIKSQLLFQVVFFFGSSLYICIFFTTPSSCCILDIFFFRKKRGEDDAGAGSEVLRRCDAVQEAIKRGSLGPRFCRGLIQLHVPRWRVAIYNDQPLPLSELSPQIDGEKLRESPQNGLHSG